MLPGRPRLSRSSWHPPNRAIACVLVILSPLAVIRHGSCDHVRRDAVRQGASRLGSHRKSRRQATGRPPLPRALPPHLQIRVRGVQGQLVVHQAAEDEHLRLRQVPRGRHEPGTHLNDPRMGRSARGVAGSGAGCLTVAARWVPGDLGARRRPDPKRASRGSSRAAARAQPAAVCNVGTAAGSLATSWLLQLAESAAALPWQERVPMQRQRTPHLPGGVPGPALTQWNELQERFWYKHALLSWRGGAERCRRPGGNPHRLPPASHRTQVGCARPSACDTPRRMPWHSHREASREGGIHQRSFPAWSHTRRGGRGERGAAVARLIRAQARRLQSSCSSRRQSSAARPHPTAHAHQELRLCGKQRRARPCAMRPSRSRPSACS